MFDPRVIANLRHALSTLAAAAGPEELLGQRGLARDKDSPPREGAQEIPDASRARAPSFDSDGDRHAAPATRSGTGSLPARQRRTG
jgi:hypothetical protein